MATKQWVSGSGSEKSECQLRLRFTAGPAIALGPGKADLLQALRETGSISAAARRLGMSYRRAWLLVNTMNQCFSAPLVETSKGGESRGGAVLTALGEEVLARYRRAEAAMRDAAASDIDAILALIRAE